MPECAPEGETALVLAECESSTAVTCHKLRTPLTAAMGFLQLALREARLRPTDDSQAMMLEMVDQQLRRMSRLIDELAEKVKA